MTLSYLILDQRSKEGDVLRKMTATLNVAISKHSDPVRFADAAYSDGFIADQVRLDTMSLVSTAYLKVSKIMSAVESHITQQTTYDEVCRMFNQFIILLHNKLELKDVARQLVDKLRECSNLGIMNPLPSLS